VDAVTNNGNEVGNTVTVQGEVDQQGTPKRQRINNNEAGSQSAPPRVPNTGNQQGNQRSAGTERNISRRLDTGKTPMVVDEAVTVPVTEGSCSSAAVPPNLSPFNKCTEMW
jgi:hypothetical protein